MDYFASFGTDRHLKGHLVGNEWDAEGQRLADRTTLDLWQSNSCVSPAVNECTPIAMI